MTSSGAVQKCDSCKVQHLHRQNQSASWWINSKIFQFVYTCTSASTKSSGCLTMCSPKSGLPRKTKSLTPRTSPSIFLFGDRHPFTGLWDIELSNPRSPCPSLTNTLGSSTTHSWGLCNKASKAHPYDNGYSPCDNCQRLVFCLGFPCSPCINDCITLHFSAWR